jgi:centromeric protein E
MQGHDGSHNDVGIVQMVAGDLFKNVEETSAERDYVVRVSYIEIYNETVRDLLDKIEKSEAGLASDGSGSRGNGAINGGPSQDFRMLAVREDPKRGGVYVDCKERQVHNAAALIDVLQDGNRNRSFASTSMNERSSRSHAIFRITLESRQRTKKVPDGVVRIANLNLVDLAGSENGHQTSTNHHRREGGKINQRYELFVLTEDVGALIYYLMLRTLLCSLLSLSQVIHALSTPPEKRQAYINYRDSKLTRLLQPYLSGNALMAVLCCVTPSMLYVEETRSALKFAARAKLITTKPTVNEVMDDSEMIKKLQHDLEKARRDLKRLEMRENSTEQSTSEVLDEFQKLKTLIFGNDDLPTFQTGHTQESTCSHPVTLARVSPSPVRGSSRMSTGRLSLRSRSRAYAIPPSEVVIMNEPLQSPMEYDPRADLNASRLKDAEQRVEFLKSKLDATEDLVESLFQDVESARGCIHRLVFKNVGLTNQIEKLNIEFEETATEAETQKFQQYLLLKYCMYGGLFFFMFGYHDLYFCAVLFLWLSLEALTECKLI